MPEPLPSRDPTGRNQRIYAANGGVIIYRPGAAEWPYLCVCTCCGKELETSHLIEAVCWIEEEDPEALPPRAQAMVNHWQE